MKTTKINIGININDSTFDWTEAILSGRKTIETRNFPTLDPYIDKRVGIIRTGKGPAQLVGFVDIVAKKTYMTAESFRYDEDLHLVSVGGVFDFKRNPKFGYILENPERLSVPVPVTSKGIVSRRI